MDQVHQDPTRLGPLPTQVEEAASRYLPTWRAEQLAKVKSKQVRMALDGNAYCPPGALCLMQTDRCVDVRTLVASHPSCPSDALGILARDPDRGVRLSVTRHANTSQEVLAEFAQCADDSCRRFSAQNQNCPSGALVTLMRNARVELSSPQSTTTDDTSALRQTIASHHNYPPGDLQILQDPSLLVR